MSRFDEKSALTSIIFISIILGSGDQKEMWVIIRGINNKWFASTNAHSSEGTLMLSLPLMWFFKIFILWHTCWFLATLLLICPPLKEVNPASSNLNSGHPDCTLPSPVAVGAGVPHPLSPSPPVLLFPRWQGPRAPLFSILVGGRRALCLAAIVPDTRFYLTDTRAVKRERERRRRGHRWPLFWWWWRWKDETRWPSVVRVCNL